MSIPPAKSPRQPNAQSPVVLPDELIAEILSMLPVKPLTRLRCVSKSWNTLISDPTFVNMHLQRSKRNPHLTLMLKPRIAVWYPSPHIDVCSVVPFPVRRLLENQPVNVADDTCYLWKCKDCCRVVGSCNGLVCLLCCKFSVTDVYQDYWLCFWNPATRITSEKLGSLRDFGYNPFGGSFKFTFGYDNSTRTYKVVAFRGEGLARDKASWRCDVRVFSLGNNSWRKIQSFPVLPLSWLGLDNARLNEGVHLSGTVNWLADHRINFRYSFYVDDDATVEQFVILSLDLSTETYKQLLLPRGFDTVPRVHPTIRILMDCLCFSHDKGTDFVIWQMKEFGVQESWTQLLKISYQNLRMCNGFGYPVPFLPLCLSENGDTLILAIAEEDRAIICNWRDNRVERTRINNKIWWFWTKDYVESLVSF